MIIEGNIQTTLGKIATLLKIIKSVFMWMAHLKKDEEWNCHNNFLKNY